MHSKQAKHAQSSPEKMIASLSNGESMTGVDALCSSEGKNDNTIRSQNRRHRCNKISCCGWVNVKKKNSLKSCIHKMVLRTRLQKMREHFYMLVIYYSDVCTTHPILVYSTPVYASHEMEMISAAPRDVTGLVECRAFS